MATIDAASVYPPAHHVLRDLAFEVQPGRTINRAWLTTTDMMCNPNGRLHTGLLATMVDAICGGLAAVTAAPGWIATADLTMHVARPLEGDEFAAVARVRRAGRTTVVLEAEVHSDANIHDPIAIATATFSVLQRREQNPTLEAVQGDDQPRRAFVGSTNGFTEPAYGACSFRYLADGVVEVPVHDYILNSLGGVQGGILASLIDAATVHALGDGFETVDLYLTYLALAKQGPIRATPAITHRDSQRGAVSIEVHDTGAQRRNTVANCVGVRW